MYLTLPPKSSHDALRKGIPFELSEIERQNMEEAFGELGKSFSLRAFKRNGLFDAQQPHVFQAIGKAFADSLTPNNLAYLQYFIYNSAISPVVYLEGFPVGDVPKTPKSISSRGKPHISEFISVGLLALADRSFKNLKIGNVVLREDDNLRPISGTEDTMFEPFHTHCDLADFGVLYCLKGTNNVSSLIITTDSLWQSLMNDPARDLLFTPLRYFGEDKDAVSLIRMQVNGRFALEFSPEFTHNEDFLNAYIALVQRMVDEQNPDALQAANLGMAITKNWLNAASLVSYKAGDVAIINQRSTVRGILIDGLHQPDVEDRYLLSTTTKFGDDIARTTPTMSIDHVKALLKCASTTQR